MSSEGDDEAAAAHVQRAMRAPRGTLECPECGGTLIAREGKYGPFWGCTKFPRCYGSHGAHPDGRPLGTPANKALKGLRIAAHAAFDELWRSGKLSPRNAAYAWLAEAMQLTPERCHMGMMDEGQCRRVIALCEEKARL